MKDRKKVLELFFKAYGHLANIDNIFLDAINDIPDGIVHAPHNPFHLDSFMASKTNYTADMEVGKQKFTIPWMTPGGTFIINGVRKVPLIQEVKAKQAIFVVVKNDQEELTVVATTKFPMAKVPVRLVLGSKEIFLDISVIARQLESVKDVVNRRDKAKILQCVLDKMEEQSEEARSETLDDDLKSIINSLTNLTVKEFSRRRSNSGEAIFTRETLTNRSSYLASKRRSIGLGEIVPSPVKEEKVTKELSFDRTKYTQTWVIFDGIVIGYTLSNGDVYRSLRDDIKTRYRYVSVSMASMNVIEIRTWCGRPMR